MGFGEINFYGILLVIWTHSFDKLARTRLLHILFAANVTRAHTLGMRIGELRRGRRAQGSKTRGRDTH